MSFQTGKGIEIYRNEAEELLGQLEETVLRTESGDGNGSAAHDLFRIIHTIKGSSDMFGLHNVGEFSHHLENTLEGVRNGAIPFERELADIVLEARDVIKGMIENHFAQKPESNEAATKRQKLLERLEKLLNTTHTPDSESAKPAFTPRPEEEIDPLSDREVTEYHIVFAPNPEIFHSGGEPAAILDELRELGACRIQAVTENVPPLAELKPEQCLLMWEIYLTTIVPETVIRDVFIFFSEEEYSIRPVHNLTLNSGAPDSSEASHASSPAVPQEACAPKPEAKTDNAARPAADLLFDDELLHEFITESREHLETIEDDFLRLEAMQDSPDSELVNKIFRSIHSMKGSSGFLNLMNISKLSHSMETLLSMIRSGSIRPERRYIEALLNGVDHLNTMLADIRKSNSHDITEILQILDNLIRGISSDVSRAMDETVSIPGGDTPGFTIDELTYRTLHQKGHCIYILKYDLRTFESINRVTLKNLMGDLVKLGNILDVQVRYPEARLTDRLEAMNMEFELLYSTVIEPDLIADATSLTDGDIRQIKESDISRAPSKTAETRQTTMPERKTSPTPATPGASAPTSQEESDASAGGARRSEPKETVRVPSERLDSLVNLVGEMVITQARLSAASSTNDLVRAAAAIEEMDRLIAELRDTVLTIRMMPIGSTFSRFRRLVRDLSAELGKKIVMETEGAETEMDKTVLDKLGDPLVHLIRNSIDHGIEMPEDRLRKGKKETGTITLAAAHKGAHVVITIQDDGKGLDAAAIRAKAIEKGLITAETELSEGEMFGLIFQPGFSTAKQVSSVSGRGVGMDVVKKQIESLRGTVEIASHPGKGTTISLSLPLTLAIIDGLLVRIEEDRYIIPLSAVKESVELTRSERESHNRRNLIQVRGKQIPYIRLRELFNVRSEMPELEYAVIIEFEERSVGIVVDKVLGNHQTVIKSLGRLYRNIDVVSGATIMGDGQVALILDIAGVVKAKITSGHENEAAS